MPDFTSSDAQAIFGAGLFVVISWAIVHLAFYLTGARDKDRQARELAEQRRIQRDRAIQFLRILETNSPVQMFQAAIARMRVLAFDKFGIQREMTAAEQREFEELDDLIRRIMATAPVDVERDKDGIQTS